MIDSCNTFGPNLSPCLHWQLLFVFQLSLFSCPIKSFFWKCYPKHRINHENAAGIDQNVGSVFPIWLSSTDTHRPPHPTLSSFSIFTLLTLCRGPICVLTRHPTPKVQDRLAHCPIRYGSRIFPEGTGSSF